MSQSQMIDVIEKLQAEGIKILLTPEGYKFLGVTIVH